MRLKAIALCVALALSSGASWITAQSLTSGDISGTVSDPSGATLPGASVTATNRATGVVQSTTTNQSGFYHFAFLPPASYQVEVKAVGFQVARKIIEVQVGQTSTLDVKASLSQATTTVEVTEAPVSVQTEDANITTNVNKDQLALLPNSGNDMTYEALVAPGTVISTSSGYGNFSSFGLPAVSNLFTLNGQNDNDMFLNLSNSGASNLMLGANELAEATVVSNGYSGQYGQLAGAQVNFLTKSGGNRFHGNANWNWNGRTMNANDWFNNQAGVARPFSNANQYSASVGGPVWKNKTFFFFDYEGLKNVLPSGVLAKVPTPAFEAATIANLTKTGQAAAVGFYNQMFALYNGAAGIGSAVAVPGGGCGTFTGLSGAPCAEQFRATNGNHTSEYLWSTRVDHHFSDRDQAFIRLWRDNGTQPTYTDPIAPIFNIFSPQPQLQGQFSETHTFSPTSINQLIFSAFYYAAQFAPPDENAVLAALPTVVRFSPALFSPIGGEGYAFPQGRKVTQYQFLDDYSKTFAHHTVKVGMNYRHYDVNDLSFQEYTNGRITENNLTDFFNGGGTGNSLLQRFPTAPEELIKAWQLGAYAMDEMRIGPSLKLSWALRVDHDSNPVCGNNCFNQLAAPFTDLNHSASVPYNQVILANQSNAYAHTDRFVWQPRFGFAWTPTKSGNTVLRGGVGIFENANPGSISDSIARQTPGLNSFTVANGKITPGVAGNLFAVASAANQSLLSAFNSGGTLASIKAGNPLFTAPAFTTTDGTFHTARYYEYNVELQQKLPWKMIMSANFVGNRGVKEILVNTGLNGYCPVASCGGFGGLPTVIPDARFGSISQITNAGYSYYNGLTIGVKRQMSGGFLFGINYTYSHATDLVSNGGLESYDLNSAPSILNPTNPYYFTQNYGNADYDVRHYVNANYLWQDIGRRFTKRGPNFLIGGWSIAGNVYHRTGLPFTVVDSNISLAGTFAPEAFFAQPVGTGNMVCGKSSIDTPCFSATQFADPTKFSTQTRNQYRGPGFFDTDLNVLKDFHIPRSETMKFTIGAQFANLFNHPNFDKPINDLGALGSGFGQIQNTVTPPTSIYGAFVGSAVSGRLVQMQAKFVF